VKVEDTPKQDSRLTQIETGGYLDIENPDSNLDPLFVYWTLFFVYDPLIKSLHGLKKTLSMERLENQ